MKRLVAALCAGGAVLAGCTPGHPGSPTTSTEITTITKTRPAPTSHPPTPVSTAPTTSGAASTCPLLTQQFAASTTGMRLDRITVQKSGGRVVGCRIYGLQHPADGCDALCLKKENLPPGSQPAIEVSSIRYASAAAVRDAFIALAEKGANLQQAKIAGSVGLCYQTDFYAKDHGTDWACAYGRGPLLVLVKTVVTTDASDVIGIAKAVAPKF